MRICSLNTNLLLHHLPPPNCSCINTPICASIVTSSSLPPSSIIHRRRNSTQINSLSTTHKQNQQLLRRPNTKKTTRAAVRACAAASLELPLLPFPLDQVLVPTESKTLHLYEARYLKLLDESLNRKSKLFVHFVLEPFVISSRSAEASYAAKYGCLAFIEKVEQLDIGALVTIRGIGRVTLVKFVKNHPAHMTSYSGLKFDASSSDQPVEFGLFSLDGAVITEVTHDPYIEGIVIPLQDDVPENTSEINAKTLELTTELQNLNSLEIKLKAAKDALLQTQTANALKWLEKESSLASHQAFVPSMPELVSFAALQVVSGCSESELEKLQEEKVKAMDAYDTQERLQNSLKLVKENVSLVLAKLAIQSLNLQ